MVGFAILFYIVAGVFLFLGFDKYLNYSNPEEGSLESMYEDPLNVYVGGDAYNYIINGTYMTAFFTIAGACIVAGSIFLALYLHKQKQQTGVIGHAESTSND